MKLDIYISELLYEHDCVIVPGFGGFVGNYSKAEIQSGKHQFRPPFKKISFNKNLQNNDGLLANKIGLAQNTSYAEANALVLKYVDTLNHEINSQKRTEIENVGIVYLGQENTLYFEQDYSINFLADSFGLSTFHSLPIKREPIERKIEKQFQNKTLRESKVSKIQSGTRKKYRPIMYAGLSMFLLFTISFFYVSSQTELLNENGFANLNPFSKKITSLYNPSLKIVVPPMAHTVIEDNIHNLITLNNDTQKYFNFKLNDTTSVIVSLQDETKVEDKPAKKQEGKIKHFHIVGGAFVIYKNAKLFLSRLVKLGFEASIIDKKNGTLHLVSYGDFTSREDALQAIDTIRARQNDVWIMNN